MSRRPSPVAAQRHAPVVPRSQERKAEHPCWGYRRIWAYLRFVEQYPINKKRVWRLMREHQRLVQPHIRLQAKRTPTRSKPRPTKPDEWWGIDMTKVLVEGFGWVDIVVVLDWYTKKIVGYAVALRGTTPQWLVALDMAVSRQFPEGARGRGLCLMSDNGCQPTSAAFMQACSTLGVHQVFTSDNNPKGHADTERVMRTRQEECLWLHEWTSPVTFTSALARWINEDNTHDLHSALGYKPPRQFEREYHLSHGTRFVAA